MKNKILVAFVALFSVSLCFGANGVQYYDINKAFATKQFQKLNAVSFEFGSGSSANVIRQGLRAHQKAKGAAKNPELACQTAFFKTLVRFQKTAKKMGAPKVVNLVGRYYDQMHDNNATFQCWIVDNVAATLYYGDVAN